MEEGFLRKGKQTLKSDGLDWDQWSAGWLNPREHTPSGFVRKQGSRSDGKNAISYLTRWFRVPPVWTKPSMLAEYVWVPVHLHAHSIEMNIQHHPTISTAFGQNIWLMIVIYRCLDTFLDLNVSSSNPQFPLIFRLKSHRFLRSSCPAADPDWSQVSLRSQESHVSNRWSYHSSRFLPKLSAYLECL